VSFDASERIFAMSAFEAVRIIRQYRSKHSGLPLDDLIALIHTIEPDAAAHDYEAGRFLDTLVEATIDGADPTRFYRACIDATIHRNGIWVKIILRGRGQFVGKLARNEEQCFRSAGLLLEPPPLDVVEWWDRTSGLARLASDQEKLRRARQAEYLSIEHERLRLKSLGIGLDPVWMAIEDNTAGYDVLSYDVGPVAPVSRLIEVKSTIASPLRFFITRHEWETAIKYGTSYFFHIWDLQIKRLYERTVADITPHIPTDNVRGRWTNMEVPVLQPSKP
jgi:hypothetical protein